MPQKTTLLTIFAIVIAALLAAYAFLRPAPAVAPGENPSAIVLPPGHYEESAKYYDISANYATSTPLAPAADAAARSQLYTFIRDTIAQFKTDGRFDNLSPRDIRVMGYDRGRKQTLNIVYLIGSSSRTISYIFTVYADTLGAHGNTTFATFTFDTKTGKALALSDIFQGDYLDTLSSISRSQIAAAQAPNADTEQINAGTAPDAKNFADFFFDNREFVILFAPYQAGPYAAGPQTVRIPLSELSSVLKPAYR